MLSVQRVLHGTTDVSLAVNDFRAGVYTFAYTTGSYLYVASEVPFNNLWLDISPANVVAATPTVQIWWANAWHNAVDVVDQTAVAGASLAQPGRLAFSTDRLKGWDFVDDPALHPAHGIVAPIYSFYWVRLSWSANLTITTGLKYIGQKFSSDAELFSRYPDLNNARLMTSFGAGTAKSDWNEQSFMAAEQLIGDLVSKKIVLARGQVFDWSRFVDASCHKVAEIVYRGLGSAYDENRKGAAADFREAMNKDSFRVDRNLDGRLSPSEKNFSVTFMTR